MQAHDLFAGPVAADHDLADLLKVEGRGVVEFAVRAAVGQNFWVNQGAGVDHDVGSGQEPGSLEGDQFGVARTRSDDVE